MLLDEALRIEVEVKKPQKRFVTHELKLILGPVGGTDGVEVSDILSI